MKPAIIPLAKNENGYKCNSYTVFTVLFWIFFTINIGGIGACFVYFYWYLKKMLYMLPLDKLTLKIELIILTTIKLILKNLMQIC